MKPLASLSLWARTIAVILTPASVLLIAPESSKAQFVVTVGGEFADEGRMVLPDGAGGAFVTGIFVGEVDFEPGGGQTVLNDPDLLGDIFLARYDEGGDLVFAVGFGNDQSSSVQGLASDGSGGVWVAGSFRDTLDLDPGAGTTLLISAGGFDIYLARFDGAGNLVSGLRLGNSSAIGTESANVLLDDAAGGVYMGGRFYGTMDFDPGGGTANLSADNTIGSSDAYVAHYDVSGNYQSAFRVGAAGADDVLGLAPDGTGGIYVGGLFAGTVDFDPGVGSTTRTSSGARDAFVARYDASGDFVSVFSFGGVNGENLNDIAADDSSGVFATGSFFGGADFDPTDGTLNRTSEGNDDMFVARYDSNGNVVFAHAFGTNGFSERGNCVRSDGAGGVYVAGTFQNTIDFDPGAETSAVVSNGSNDIILAHYTGTGDYVSAYGAGGLAADEAWCMGYGGPDQVFLTGGFQSTVDFDGGPGVDERTTNGSLDIFLVKLSNIPTPEATSMMSVTENGTVDFGSDVGVCIDFDNIFGPGEVTVERYQAPVISPQGVDEPVVYETHWRIVASFGLIFGPNTVLRIKLDDLPPGMLPDPSNIQFYKRSLYGAGRLEPVITTYDAESNELRMTGFDSFSEFVGAGEVELPVELSSFTAVASGTDVTLRWTTESESSNAGFEVQRALGPGGWQSTGFVSGRGTADEPTNYHHTIEALVPGLHRFRLKQVDHDGSFTYSQIVEAVVEVPGTHFLSEAYPNPFNPSVNFVLTIPVEQRVRVDLYDALGRHVQTVFHGVLAANEGHRLSVAGTDLPSGTYVLKAIGETFSESRSATLVK